MILKGTVGTTLRYEAEIFEMADGKLIAEVKLFCTCHDQWVDDGFIDAADLTHWLWDHQDY